MDGDGDLDLAFGNSGTANLVHMNGLVQRPHNLWESPVSPVVADRPGTTNAGFFQSSAECLQSPIALDYLLVDEESDPARQVSVKYSTTGGGSWSPATDGGSGGLTDLAADPAGVGHQFLWDAETDGIADDSDLVLRITVPHQASTILPYPIQRAAMSADSPPFRICDPIEALIFEDDFESGDTSAWSGANPDSGAIPHGAEPHPNRDRGRATKSQHSDADDRRGRGQTSHQLSAVSFPR